MKCVCGHDSSEHEWNGDPPKEEQRKWEQRSNEWISKENRPNKLPCFCFECSDGTKAKYTHICGSECADELEGCRGFKEIGL